MTKQFNINELQLKYLELETLLDITNELNSFENVSVLLQEILIKSCAVLNASSGLILMQNNNSDLFQIEAEFNIDVEALKGIIFNKKKGFFNEVNQNRKPLAVEILNDPFLSRTNCTFGLIAPLLDKKDLVGVIVLFDKESRAGISSFDDSDTNMLSAIASQAGVAYNNIKLMENIKEAKTFNDNIMQSIVTGVFTTNLMGEISHVNRAAAAIINLEREMVIGNHYEYVFESNEIINALISKCEEVLATISETQIQIDCNGKSTSVNISVSPLLNDLNEPIGSVVAMEDLSNLDKLKSTFKKYVSKQIVDQLLENEDMLNLGGQEQEATILFSDIRGFTSMSETMTPTEVVETLNDYFNLMIEIIFKYNGTLDKIIGDALMVIYGAPNSTDKDTENAVLTAIEMQEKLIEFNQLRIINSKPPITIGIGINRGKVISGNIGSRQQMNFTVIGDSVNLASRLCSVAASDEIIVSDAVWKKVKHLKSFKSKKLNPVKVKGKAKPIEIKEILYNRPEFQYELANKKIEEFQILYETEQKDKEIANLATQNELKEEANKNLVAKQEAENSASRIIYIALGSGVILLGFIGVLLFRASQRRKKTNDLLKVTNENLKSKNAKIESQAKQIGDSIAYARNIQNAILPLKSEMSGSLSEHFVYYMPKDIVSGDFYWIRKHNDDVCIAIADCTGHGVPGAFMSMLGISAINDIVNNMNRLIEYKVF